MATKRKVGQLLHGATFVQAGNDTLDPERYAEAYWSNGKYVKVRRIPNGWSAEGHVAQFPDASCEDWFDAIAHEERRRITFVYLTVHPTLQHPDEMTRRFGVTEGAIKGAASDWAFRRILSEALYVVAGPTPGCYHFTADISAKMKWFAETYLPEDDVDSKADRLIEKTNEQIALDLLVSNFNQITRGPAEWYQLAISQDDFSRAMKVVRAEIGRRKMATDHAAQAANATSSGVTSR